MNKQSTQQTKKMKPNFAWVASTNNSNHSQFTFCCPNKSKTAQLMYFLRSLFDNRLLVVLGSVLLLSLTCTSKGTSLNGEAEVIDNVFPFFKEMTDTASHQYEKQVIESLNN